MGRRVIKRVLVGLVLAVVALVALAYVGTALLGVVPPQTLYRIETTQPSRWGDVFPARTVAAPAEERALPRSSDSFDQDVPWKGDRIPVTDFLETTDTDAFVVVEGGKITYEWYADGTTATTRLSSWSVAKSVVSLLVGQAIDRGELSEDDRLVDVLPELETGGDYDRVTVRDLLDMTAGIDVPEDYNEYWPFTGTARMYITKDLRDFVADHRTTDFVPGSKGVYRSVNTQLLGLILEKVTGEHLADLLSHDLWKPIGAGHDATWNLDQEGGNEKAFCCINATARDYARLGQLVLDDGRVGDTQVLPTSWITRISTAAPHEVDGWGYSAQWWHPPGGTGDDFSAIGIYGQYIYVNPTADVVIVKLSDYGTEQDEQDTIDAFRALAAG